MLEAIVEHEVEERRNRRLAGENLDRCLVCLCVSDWGSLDTCLGQGGIAQGIGKVTGNRTSSHLCVLRVYDTDFERPLGLDAIVSRLETIRPSTWTSCLRPRCRSSCTG